MRVLESYQELTRVNEFRKLSRVNVSYRESNELKRSKSALLNSK